MFLQQVLFQMTLISILQYSCLVHALRPGDIKYVGAIGDSLTVSIREGKNLPRLKFSNYFRLLVVEVLQQFLVFSPNIEDLHGGNLRLVKCLFLTHTLFQYWWPERSLQYYHLTKYFVLDFHTQNSLFF